MACELVAVGLLQEKRTMEMPAVSAAAFNLNKVLTKPRCRMPASLYS